MHSGTRKPRGFGPNQALQRTAHANSAVLLAEMMTVTWPDGSSQTFDGLAADRYYRVSQGKAEPVPDPAKP